MKSEVVGQGPSGDPLLCPRDALARRIIHLHKHNADKTQPITSFMTPKGSWKHVTPTMITKVIKGAVSLSGENLGFLPKDVSARSLQSDGAMALLCSGIDTDINQLIGRWRSDEMLRYLHLNKWSHMVTTACCQANVSRMSPATNLFYPLYSSPSQPASAVFPTLLSWHMVKLGPF